MRTMSRTPSASQTDDCGPPMDSDDEGAMYRPPPMQTATNDEEEQVEDSAEEDQQTSDSNHGELQGDDWKQVLDEQSRKYFWYNQRTKRSQWERPLARTMEVVQERKARKRDKKQRIRRMRDEQRAVYSQLLQEQATPAVTHISKKASKGRQNLGSVWTKHLDQTTGKPFWFNRDTKQSTWKDPSQKSAEHNAAQARARERSRSARSSSDGAGLFPRRKSRTVSTTIPNTFSRPQEESETGSILQQAAIDPAPTATDVGTPRAGWREKLDATSGQVSSSLLPHRWSIATAVTYTTCPF